MAHVFISYAREDREWAKVVLQWLEKSGFEAWMADPDFRYRSQEWKPTVNRAIEESFVVLLIVTPFAAKSSFFEHEWNQAEVFQKPTIPLIFGHASDLLSRYRPLGELDFTDPQSYPWRSLTRALIRAAQKMPRTELQEAVSESAGDRGGSAPLVNDKVSAARPFMNGGWAELRTGNFRLACRLFGRASQIGLNDGEAERWQSYSLHMADGLELAKLKRYDKALHEFNLALKQINQPGKAAVWGADVMLNLIPSQKTAEIWIQRTGEALGTAQRLATSRSRGSGENMKIDLAELNARDELEAFHQLVLKALEEPDVTRPLSVEADLNGGISAEEKRATGTINSPDAPEGGESLDDESEETLLLPKAKRATGEVVMPLAGRPAASQSPVMEPDAQLAQFTAYGPKEMPTETWSSLIVYAHTKERANSVRSDIEKLQVVLPQPAHEASSDQTAQLTRGTELTLIPYAEGFTFNPERLTFRWWEDMHRAMFRMRADKRLRGTAANILLGVYIGPVIVATVKIGVLLTDPTSASLTPQPAEIGSAELYRAEQIFISYSRKDTDIAIACRNAYRALGFDVLMDMDTLRAGQNWNEELKRMIDRATIFQLFWSARSAQSTFVHQEWQYALQKKGILRGEGFIRPVYWEDPIVPPPDELKHLHFEYIPLPRLPF